MKYGIGQRFRRAIAAFREDPSIASARAAHAVPDGVSGATPPAAPAEDTAPSPLMVGQRDRMMEGWINEASGELVAGMKILPEHTVVDVGCGEGGFTRFCAARGARVVFVDIAEEKLRRLEQELRNSAARSVEAHVSDCNPLPLPDAEADIVICTEVLEHVDDPVLVMRELARVGKPGARYVLSVPHPASEGLIAATGADFYFRKPNHIRVLSPDAFDALAVEAGLVVERHEYISAFWAICLPLTYIVGQPLEPPWHPMISHWSCAWSLLLDHPRGLPLKKALDAVVPRTQILIARKPGP